MTRRLVILDAAGTDPAMGSALGEQSLAAGATPAIVDYYRALPRSLILGAGGGNMDERVLVRALAPALARFCARSFSPGRCCDFACACARPLARERPIFASSIACARGGRPPPARARGCSRARSRSPLVARELERVCARASVGPRPRAYPRARSRARAGVSSRARLRAREDRRHGLGGVTRVAHADARVQERRVRRGRGLRRRLARADELVDELRQLASRGVRIPHTMSLASTPQA